MSLSVAGHAQGHDRAFPRKPFGRLSGRIHRWLLGLRACDGELRQSRFGNPSRAYGPAGVKVARKDYRMIDGWFAALRGDGAVAPGDTQRSMTEDIPPMVGNERQNTDDGRPWGPMGMTGPCGEVGR